MPLEASAGVLVGRPRLPRPSARSVAFGAICVQFLALVRTLAEVVRLRSTITVSAAVPFVASGLLISVMAWIAVGLLFGGRPRATTFVAAVTIAALFAIKAVFL